MFSYLPSYFSCYVWYFSLTHFAACSLCVLGTIQFAQAFRENIFKASVCPSGRQLQLFPQRTFLIWKVRSFAPLITHATAFVIIHTLGILAVYPTGGWGDQTSKEVAPETQELLAQINKFFACSKHRILFIHDSLTTEELLTLLFLQTRLFSRQRTHAACLFSLRRSLIQAHPIVLHEVFCNFS